MQIIVEEEDIDQKIQHKCSQLVDLPKWLPSILFLLFFALFFFLNFQMAFFFSFPTRNEKKNIGQLLWEQFDT